MIRHPILESFIPPWEAAGAAICVSQNRLYALSPNAFQVLQVCDCEKYYYQE